MALDDHDQTWTHMALFESQLIKPPEFKAKKQLENYQEFISKFKFGKWILSDMDNYMLGNPMFLNVKPNLYDHPVFEGTSKDLKFTPNIRRTN